MKNNHNSLRLMCLVQKIPIKKKKKIQKQKKTKKSMKNQKNLSTYLVLKSVFKLANHQSVTIFLPCYHMYLSDEEIKHFSLTCVSVPDIAYHVQALKIITFILFLHMFGAWLKRNKKKSY